MTKPAAAQTFAEVRGEWERARERFHSHFTPKPGRQLRLVPRDPEASEREAWRRLAIAMRDARHRFAVERLAQALSRRCPQCGRGA